MLGLLALDVVGLLEMGEMGWMVAVVEETGSYVEG